MSTLNEIRDYVLDARSVRSWNQPRESAHDADRKAEPEQA